MTPLFWIFGLTDCRTTKERITTRLSFLCNGVEESEKYKEMHAIIPNKLNHMRLLDPRISS